MTIKLKKSAGDILGHICVLPRYHNILVLPNVAVIDRETTEMTTGGS